MARQLTIAHLDSDLGFSGGEVQVFLLLEGLRARGFRNVLFCQPGSRCEAEGLQRGFDLQRVPMRNYLDVPAVHRLRRQFRTTGVDLIHANTGRDTWLGGWAAYSSRIPAITTRRMDRRVKAGMRTDWIYNRLFRRVAAISPGVVECLLEGGVPASRVVLIPESADPARVTPSCDRSQARANLGVHPEQILVVGLGALIHRKGFDVLLEALARLDPTVLDQIQVRIGGDGSERGALEAKAKDLGLEGHVWFLGRREDVGDLLNASDVFVIPSRREGLGVAALEAMAAGKPVIASDVGGLAFSVNDETTGLVVPPEDVQALSIALGRIVVKGECRTQFGVAAKARAAEHFVPERMVDAYVQLYEEVLAERGESRPS